MQLLHSALLNGLGLGRLRGRSAKNLMPLDDRVFCELINNWLGVVIAGKIAEVCSELFI